MMFAFSRDGAVPGHRLWRRRSRSETAIPRQHRLGDLRALVPADGAHALERLRRLSASERRSLSSASTSRSRSRSTCGCAQASVRARRLASRQALQVDRLDRDRSGSSSSAIVFMLPIAQVGVPWNDALRLELRQLHAADGGRRVLALRRLVRAVGPQVVQGAGATGRPRKSSPASRASTTPRGRQLLPPPRRNATLPRRPPRARETAPSASSTVGRAIV